LKVVRLGREVSVRLVRAGVLSVKLVSWVRPGTERVVILLLISCNWLSSGVFSLFRFTVKAGLLMLLIDSSYSADNELLN
jgi:hypothetical protein